MTGDLKIGSMSGRLSRFVPLLLAAMSVASQETCSTVTVTGGNFAGDYELGDEDAYTGVETTTHVLQAIPFGEGARVRRDLSEVNGRAGSILTWSGRWRQLVNDCETQMWILTDGDTMEDGFPYYGAFDCADHPADIDSDWIYIDCDECAELAEIDIVCGSEDDTSLGTGDAASDDGGGDSIFTLPIIVGIIVVGLIVVLCIGFLATRRRKKTPTGSHNDSEHGASKIAQVVAPSAPPPHYTSTYEDGSNRGNLVGGETDGNSTVLYPPVQGKHGRSFNKTQQIVDNSIYNLPFASGASGGQASRHESRSVSSQQPSRAESLERIRLDPRRDSMAEAAAAAHATLSQARGIEMAQQQQSAGPQGVLRTGGVNRHPPGGGGVKWSAGQNFVPQVDYYDGGVSQSSDSAAGSVFSYHIPPDDTLQEHSYDCDDSVAASSPGAYSMYSHFTAGGRTYVGGMSEWSSDADESESRGELPVAHPPQDVRGKPPAYMPPTVAFESRVHDSMPSGQATGADVFFSPSEVVARCDHGSSNGVQDGDTRSEEMEAVSR